MDEFEAQLAIIDGCARYSSDPHGFALWAFPWGESGALKNAVLDPWQIELLNSIGNGVLTVESAIAEAQRRGEDEVECPPMLEARASGHGIGKSALVSIIILWAISTMEDTKGVVTANTENQLKTKTWAELAKWYRMCLARSLFKMTATAIFSVDPDHERTWRIDMVPWSEKNPEAFAGLHNYGKRILVVFDEASAVADIIWETTEGALTDKNTQIIWCAFGNPTKNSGRFRECFNDGKFAHRWNSLQIDSRTVTITNKEQLQRWVDDYGEDHDFTRVRVKGMFPRIDAVSFISREAAIEATLRELPEYNQSSVVIGVDCARMGADPAVIYPRRGRDARSLEIEIIPTCTTVQLTHSVHAMFLKYNAVAVCVDVGGVGAGVYDQLNALGVPAYAVDFGSKPEHTNLRDPNTQFLNRRAEIWYATREFLADGGCIPNQLPKQEPTLVDELTAPTYTMRGDVKLQLESKADLKRRKIASPNVADALALTLAYPAFSDLPAMSFASSKDYEPPNPHRANLPQGH